VSSAPTPRRERSRINGVRLAVLLGATAALAVAAVVHTAVASITIGYDAGRPVLKIDANGNAEVDWTERGVRKTMWIPTTGRYLPGGHISGPDVSKPAHGVALPYLRVVRRTPDGRLWALQSWPVQPNGQVELRFSRWQGPTTAVTGDVADGRLTGTAIFQGHGVDGFSPTTAGTPVRLYAWVDCWRCDGASGWQRLTGVRLVGPSGIFSLYLRPAWESTRYRVTVPGPNRGATYAPDVVALVAAG